MTWAIVAAEFVWGAVWGAGIVITLMAWRRERRCRREAEQRTLRVRRQEMWWREAAGKRIARARIELVVANAHLLKFSTEWAAPLKARPCVLKAIEILDGKAKRHV